MINCALFFCKPFFYKNNQAGKKLQGWEIDQINETWHKWSIDETECTSLEETLQ